MALLDRWITIVGGDSSIGHWYSLGNPRKHEMKTLGRAATQSSASFHQRSRQWASQRG